MTLPIPTEDQEQAWFVEYLRVKGYKHFRVPSETYTKSIKQKVKNKRLGVVPGVPDLFVIVGDQLVAIEMKRTKHATVSDAQREWIEALKDAGVMATVCYGYEQAVEFVEMIEDAQAGRITMKEAA